MGFTTDLFFVESQKFFFFTFKYPPPPLLPSHPLLQSNPFPFPLHHPTHPQPFHQLPSPQALFSSQKETEKEKDFLQLQPPHPTNPLLLLMLSPSPSSLFFPSPYQTSAHHPPPFTSFPPLSPPTPSCFSPLPSTPQPKPFSPPKAPLIL